MHITVRRLRAMRTARSTKCLTCSGVDTHLHEFMRDILEQRNQVDFLLIITTQDHAVLLAYNIAATG